MIKPNKSKPVDAAAEKYNFFLDSFFWFNLTLLSKMLISVLFETSFGLSFSKYLATNFSFTLRLLRLRFLIIQLNHEYLKFANFLRMKDRCLKSQDQELNLRE